MHAGFQRLLGRTDVRLAGRSTENTIDNHRTSHDLIVGGGFQKTLAPHVAQRADANVVLAFFFRPAGLRALVTAVVPLGR
jgi:hypothetical protein